MGQRVIHLSNLSKVCGKIEIFDLEAARMQKNSFLCVGGGSGSTISLLLVQMYLVLFDFT